MVYNLICIPGDLNSNILSDIQDKKMPLYQYKTKALLLAIWRHKNSFKVKVFNNLGVEEKYLIINRLHTCFKHIQGIKSVDHPFITQYSDYENSCIKEQMICVKNQIYLCKYRSGSIIKTKKMTNIFNSNYLFLETLKAIQVYQSSILEHFYKKDIFNIWQQSNNLEIIYNTLGFPHFMFGGCDGLELLFYFGHHKCKNGSFIGMLIIVIDKYNRIRSIYKNFEICKNCSGYNTDLLIENDDIDYFHE